MQQTKIARGGEGGGSFDAGRAIRKEFVTFCEEEVRGRSHFLQERRRAIVPTLRPHLPKRCWPPGGSTEKCCAPAAWGGGFVSRFLLVLAAFWLRGAVVLHRAVPQPSAAHAATTSADGAASAALRHHRHQHVQVGSFAQPSLVKTTVDTDLSEPRGGLWCWWWCVFMCVGEGGRGGGGRGGGGGGGKGDFSTKRD